MKNGSERRSVNHGLIFIKIEYYIIVSDYKKKLHSFVIFCLELLSIFFIAKTIYPHKTK